jgi:hypothetical protein
MLITYLGSEGASAVLRAATDLPEFAARDHSITLWGFLPQAAQRVDPTTIQLKNRPILTRALEPARCRSFKHELITTRAAAN